MSKKKTTANVTEVETGGSGEDASFDSVPEEPAASAVPDQEADEPEHEAMEKPVESKPRKRGGGLVGWLALLAAFAALAAIGWDYLRDRASAGIADESGAALASLSSTVRALQDSIDSLQQNVSALSEQLAARDRELQNIGRRLDERAGQIDSMTGRLSSVEGNVASLQGISTGARDAWLLAEAEYYMQLANAQLQLAGNPQLASHALELADERILNLANPALTDVRRALSDELRALQRLDRPDTAGITLTLASLADQVDALPLKMEIDLADDDESAVASGLSGTDRALASLRSAFSSVVTVRRTDEALKPLIAPEAQYFLRANLALQLQAARLAVLRGEESIFRRSLDDAASWLDEYFDTDSQAVQSALETIAGVRRSVFARSLPDISESLRLLRQFKTLADTRTVPISEPQEIEPAEPPQ